ncbi:MAG: alpha-glucan family phosphorylase [Patescibacteria group bacterium]
MKIQRKKNLIAYFSMEIAVNEQLNNYAGGLGILAGDLLRSAADQKIPMVGVSLLSRFGYFKQTINRLGKQKELLEDNDLKLLKKLPTKSIIMIGRDLVSVGVWRYSIKGVDGGVVPVYFLDTNFPENKEIYRGLCDRLYNGNHLHRLRQEIVLGRGGVKILEALKIRPDKFHVNEGHGALAFVELFLRDKKRDLSELKKRCIFTTHSPIQGLNDVFSINEMRKNFSDFPFFLGNLVNESGLDMAKIAIYFSGFINGVSKKHAQVSREIFANARIKSVTNGVDLNFWVSDPLRQIYNKYFPGWKMNNKLLEKRSIPEQELWLAHQKNKKELFSKILKLTGDFLAINDFTIVVARRFTPYKRSTLILQDMNRLLKIQKNQGIIQIIYSGKAHPQNKEGKQTISNIIALQKLYQDKIKIVFIEDYNIKLAKLLVAGADLWLNTPLPPNEASGTSGMKAAQNGVPQLSTLDGWWLEGCREGKTGWAINSLNNFSDNKVLLDVLESKILPIFYQDKPRWQKIMASTIRFNAYKFSSERAIKDYSKLIYEK